MFGESESEDKQEKTHTKPVMKSLKSLKSLNLTSIQSKKDINEDIKVIKNIKPISTSKSVFDRLSNPNHYSSKEHLNLNLSNSSSSKVILSNDDYRKRIYDPE
jgi:hypothetical protein